ncbi:hypothetical protein TcWFU_005477 [Taenia crassiceps]|uniref:Uncharacterized protein n=1 Tax=Taenia crassiceps TaxID=6207 RepID=A0ABR4QBA7_9CEST
MCLRSLCRTNRYHKSRGKEGHYNHPRYCCVCDHSSSAPLFGSASNSQYCRRQKWCSASTTLGRYSTDVGCLKVALQKFCAGAYAA